jgi:NAD(P)-dependent dehydrogenase (short-subunit alcohol dehydrogenase family)
MVYIVAGATGVVGSAISKELAFENEVIIIGRDEEKLSALSKEIDAEYSVIDLDNTIEQREFSKIVPDDKEIKGLVNCIGSILIKPLHGTKIEEFEDVIKVNLFSSYYLLSSFARRMKNGSAIFFSSVAGTKGLSNHEAIAAAKAGLEGMARSAAASYAKDNLRVNVIAPGLLNSNMSQRLLATEQARELSKSMYPIPKIGDFNDILPVVKWLLSDDSKWVTGQTIHVDGGLSTVKPR